MNNILLFRKPTDLSKLDPTSILYHAKKFTGDNFTKSIVRFSDELISQTYAENIASHLDIEARPFLHFSTDTLAISPHAEIAVLNDLYFQHVINTIGRAYTNPLKFPKPGDALLLPNTQKLVTAYILSQ